MSSLPRVAIVAEGPTDFHILIAAVEAALGDVVPVFVQPPADSIDATTVGGDAGPYGGGWKGVRRWCEAARQSGEWQAALDANSVLVVHVDADVADDPEIAVSQPCPPPAASVDALREVVRNWIGEVDERRCVVCVPSKASDAWLVVALGRAVSGIECDMNPAVGLRGVEGKPKAVSGSKPDKHARGYRRLTPAVTTEWLAVRSVCGEAARFHGELLAAMDRGAAG